MHDDLLPFNAELGRKAIHLLALLIPAGILVWGREAALFVLVPLTVLALAGDILRARWTPMAQLVQKLVGFLMRAKELPPAGSHVVLNGATWVLLASTLLATLFTEHIAAAALTMSMIGDAMAALVGGRFGRVRWPKSKRTLEGSAAFFSTGFVIIVLWPHMPLWVGAAGALAATVAEVVDDPLNDNLRVPLIAAFMLHVCLQTG